MLDWMVSFFETHSASIEKFWNSNGFTAIMGAFAGAWAGAFIAQKIAEKNKNREELLKEIRNTNAAISTALAIFETTTALKRQHIGPMKERYDGTREACLKFVELRKTGQVPKDQIFEFEVEFVTLSFAPLPIDILRQQLFEKLTARGRVIRLLIVLAEVAHSLSAFIEERNRLIIPYKTKTAAEPITPNYYFGFPGPDGHVNKDYASSMDAIARYLNDAIFFSHMLCQDLLVHGERLTKTYKGQFSGTVPRIVQVEFERAKDMIPDATPYRDWFTSFVEISEEKSHVKRMVAACRNAWNKLVGRG